MLHSKVNFSQSASRYPMCMPVIFSEVSLTYGFKIVFTLVFHIFLWVILNKNHALKVLQNSDFLCLKPQNSRSLRGFRPLDPHQGSALDPMGDLQRPQTPSCKVSPPIRNYAPPSLTCYRYI